MPDTIFINGKFLTSQVTGVQRYALELIRHLDGILDEPKYHKLHLVCLTPRNLQTKPKWLKVEVRSVGLNLGNLWEQLDLPQYAGGRLLFSPANTGPIFYPNQVITFHDASVFAIPNAFSIAFRMKYTVIFNMLGQLARLILTDSVFSKRELTYYCHIKPDRIKIISLGGDHLKDIPSDRTILNKNGLSPMGYFLTVSSQSLHKNFDILLDAAGRIKTNLEFVAVGGYNKRIFNSPDIHSNVNVFQMLGYVNDLQVKALYENALGFIFPSFYEGFGLPILEAMNCGCPVLCSNAASIPEVAGNAAIYFNPRSVEDIAAVINAYLADPSQRGDLITRGHEQAAAFTWETTARKTLEELITFL